MLLVLLGVGICPLLGLQMMQAVLDLGRGIGVIEPKQADISCPGNVLSPPSLRPKKTEKYVTYYGGKSSSK